jgi:hypothetical protein
MLLGAPPVGAVKERSKSERRPRPLWPGASSVEEQPMSRQGVNKKRAIRDALCRLGLHARPAQVVAALADYGMSVSEELVRAVVFELLREAARAERQRSKARTADRTAPPLRRFARVPPRRDRRG